MQKSVDSGPADLDRRFEGSLVRLLGPLQWRSDVKVAPPHNAGMDPWPPFLVFAGGGAQRYEPLRTRRLPEDFRKLAASVYEQPPSMEEFGASFGQPDERAQALIQSFVQRYGFANEWRALADEHGIEVGLGESLLYWKRELAIFRSTVILWERVQAARGGAELGRRQLEVLSEKQPNGARTFGLGPGLFVVNPSDLQGRTVAAAVSDRLRCLVQARATVSLAPLTNPLRFKPTSLLAAVYLDLAMEMVGATGARLRECEQCHHPFRASRRDRRFCSATCRSQARHIRVRERYADPLTDTAPTSDRTGRDRLDG